ncbi:MAG TPA: hypothetical protein VGJ97_09035 [Anaerolineaceae bacterium]|jgi:hypothetical protein
MPAESNPKLPVDFHHSRFTQISESHCGPAVIQMLLSNLGIEVSQEAVASAGGAANLIALNGMRVDQLARAVRLLAPQAQFWCKDHATPSDLSRLVNDFQTPVGVEWQGLFEDRLEDESEEGDYGHYSAVIIVDEDNGQVVIADPYKDFRNQDRIFSLGWFVTRWYDFNEVEDAKTGRRRTVEDRRLLFIITPADKTFPRELGMRNNV